MFKDRLEAGEKLAREMFQIDGDAGKALVLGIPRGGVVVGRVVADKFGWPLNVLICKKIGYPGQPELAMGAIAEDGEPVWDERLSERVSEKEKKSQENEAREEVKRYIKEFRGGKKLKVKAKTVIVVDDGVATGKTLEAGIKYLQVRTPDLIGAGVKVKKVVVVVPVCAKDTTERLKCLVDEWICLKEPENFYAVGQFYKDFKQVSDEEVKGLL